MHRIRTLGTSIGVAAMVVSACGAEELTSSTVASTTSAPATTLPTDTTEPPTAATSTATTPTTATTVPPTTAPPATSTPSTAPATTAPPATTVPPDTTTPATTNPDAPQSPISADGPAPSTAITLDGFDLVERDAATGDVVATLVPDLIAEATYLDHFGLTPERDRLYSVRTFEDFWYSCESSVGDVLVTDLAAGTTEVLATGWAPALSPDATTLAFLESSQCLPDPEAPNFWVVTPGDRAVVLDLATGERTEYAVAEAPGPTPTDPNALVWIGFDDDGAVLVQTATGVVHRLDPAAAGDIRSAPVVAETPDAHPVGVIDGRLIVLVTGDEGSVDVYARDLATGEQSLLVMSEYRVRVAVARSGHLLVAYDPATAPPVAVEGPVTLLPMSNLSGDIAW